MQGQGSDRENKYFTVVENPRMRNFSSDVFNIVAKLRLATCVTYEESVGHRNDRFRDSIDDSAKLGDLSSEAENAKGAGGLENIK